MASPMLSNDRLVLRRWSEKDRAAFAAMNSDPQVMEFYPHTLDRSQSDALIDQIERQFEEHGFGQWVVEVPGVARFIGYVGLSVPSLAAHFTPCVEIGWRLAAEHWGRGYATEAARLVLDHGFGSLALSEVVSFAPAINHRSRAVMERLGMRRDRADDFDHPARPQGHRLRPHVLYRLSAATYFRAP